MARVTSTKGGDKKPAGGGKNSGTADGTGARSLRDIRATFLDFFARNGHVVRPSGSLLPHDDPSLLFVNAGMVPFKNIFTGQEKAFAPRAASSQKCVRAGGKHNDLDNVGYTARHHTFFEMLGNFSFGDYFKAEAIDHAWQLITRELSLPRDRLLVTVFAEDEDAAGLWRKIAGLSDDRIIRISTNDNFWMMGDTGPCGPCSEIFYDHGPQIAGGPPGSADADGDRFVEIWNLVFMQFESHADGTRTRLPRPSIDTGMGLERIAAVLQGVHNNYDVDLFQALIAAEAEILGRRPDAATAPSFRVIADHLRTSAFLLAEGVLPSNEGRGYVLRRIMRRAMRHAHLLGAEGPVMWRLVPQLITEMGEAYPELARAEAVIATNLREEEARFQRTLGRGMALLEAEMVRLPTAGALPGETAFRLYDTFGFPLDLTEDILRGKGLRLDHAGYEAAMTRQREAGRESWAGSGEHAAEEGWLALREKLGTGSEFLGYVVDEAEAELRAIMGPDGPLDLVSAGIPAALVFDRTPFYAEAGGQAGDHGRIRLANGAVFVVGDVQKRPGGLIAHLGEVESGIAAVGARAHLTIDRERRRRIRGAHSATHLMNAALREILGPHVAQKGSLVEAERLRFDFAHSSAVREVELAAIESAVNAQIRANAASEIREMPIDDAIAAGAVAMFGEKYGDHVRVLAMGSAGGAAAESASQAGSGRKARTSTGPQDFGRFFSVELCGGTHVTRTGDIGLFVIVAESGVAAGIRRIEALTGAAAIDHLRREARIGRDAADLLRAPLAELPERVDALQKRTRALESELSDARKKLAMAGDGERKAVAETLNGIKAMLRVVSGVAPKDLRGLVDLARNELGSGIAVFIAVNDGKAAIAAGITDDLAGKLDAVAMVRAAAAAMGGQGGGGRADFAQGGAPDGAAAEAGLAAVRAVLKPAG